ncbi:HAMP domain-containing sensor histidine kinase [Cronbergia sp. UHCC 0137]|uniref:sensor histidine kinase n=1 Tax=Cronbergia sp. UHCC 0137 TaxID=3110239 RepID=UPI002B20B014|nr:HAMP domain-containing sensor histidine kinase [Cronbergia sp. UHCC 0137]MEA5617527.1 HAMP domain-containing sensor histidine kinase [Cronbergia sp. UHCC 0137]
MFQATRRRLALWYTTITAVLLLLFASGVYLYVRSTLIERIDDTLNHVVEIVERCLTTSRCASTLLIDPIIPQTDQVRVNVEAGFLNNADVEDDHIDLEWFNSTGKLIWSTFSEPLDIPIHVKRMGETVRVMGRGVWSDGDSDSGLLLRQVTKRVEQGRQVLGYLRVSHPWFEVTKPSHQLILDLALGTGLMVVSVAASGWFLSGKAMEPVGESYQRLKQFTADASHELRSPIALIQTNVQVALTDLELTEIDNTTTLHYKQQLKVVERLTQRLGKLVNDLLFLARQDSGISQEVFSLCPLDALLMEVVEEQQLLAKEKEINLTLNLIDPPLEIDPELLENWFTLRGNWDQLVRLCTNLIANALQYTPTQGSVKVELGRVSGLRYGYSQLQIKVSDTGIGIPSESLPQLFDRFYRVDASRTHRGSGLGLAIAQAIVQRHQGQIQVESIVGKGTTFTIYLPISLEY